MDGSTVGSAANETVLRFVNAVNQDKTWAVDDLLLDDHYQFTRDYYNERQQIYGPYSPKLIVQTAITLPFHLPLGPDPFSIPFVVAPEQNSFGTFLFSHFEEERMYLCGFKPEHGVRYQTPRTRCEIVAMFRDSELKLNNTPCDALRLAQIVRDSKHTDAITGDDFVQATMTIFSVYRKILGGSLDVLNAIIMNYAANADDDAVYPVDLEAVEDTSHFRIIEPQSWTTFNWMSVHSTRLPRQPRDVLRDADLGVAYGGTPNYIGNQNVQYLFLLQRASYEYRCGSSTTCLVYLVSASEVLLRRIYLLHLIGDEGMSESDAKNRLSDAATKSLLTTHLPRILGANWSIDSHSTPAGCWYAGVYELRNRVLHAGYKPSERELHEAMASSSGFFQFVFERIHARLKKRPYLAELSPTPPAVKVTQREFDA